MAVIASERTESKEDVQMNPRIFDASLSEFEPATAAVRRSAAGSRRLFGSLLTRLLISITCLCCAAAALAEEKVPRIHIDTREFDSHEEQMDRESPLITFRHGIHRVTFLYEDEGYDSVSVAGSFNDWDPEPMELDTLDDSWTLEIDLEPGRYRYHFLVRDEEGEWDAIDPRNDNAVLDEEHGWVSQLRIARERRVRYGGHSFNRYSREELERLYGREDIGLDYQRVDGLFLYWSPGVLASRQFGTSLKGKIGYGFRSEEWSASGSLVQPLDPGGHLQLVLSGYSGTAYTDQTGVGDNENDLAAILFKEDFRDYYWREGFTGQLVLNAGRYLRLAAGYRVDDYSSLENKAAWSFAGGEFRPNPPVQEGNMRSVIGQARIGGPYTHLRLEYETSGEDIAGGDFEFEQLTSQIRHRIPLGPDKRLDMRVKYGTALSGSLPNQRRYLAGGLGTVRGYDYQSLLTGDQPPGAHGGQEMLLANAEITFDLDWSWLWNWTRDWDDNREPAHHHNDLGFDLALFFDSGMAWEDRNAEIDLDEMKSSVGVGLLFGGDDGGIRLDAIHPLDRQDKDIVWELRIERMF